MPDNTLGTAQNIGTLGTATLTYNDFVGSSDTIDYYRFNLTSTRDINVTLTLLGADANIRLIRDIDNDGVIDSGEVIGSSSLGGTTPESININNASIGTYYLEVKRVNSNNTNYRFQLSSDDPSNLIAREDDLSYLSTSTITRTGVVGNSDTSDIYRFFLSNTSDVNIILTGLNSDANLRLFRESNGNGIVDATEVISSSSLSGTTPESINLNNQVAGVYFIQVYQYSSNDANYTLRVNNANTHNLIAREDHLGYLSTNVITRTGVIDNSDTSDIYRFFLDSTSDVNVALSGLSADADIRFFQETNNNGVLDETEVIAGSYNGGTTPDLINLNNQAAGSYFVQVFQKGNNNTDYTLRLSSADPSNIIAKEGNFFEFYGGTIVTQTGSVGSTDTSDIYQIFLDNFDPLNISLTGLSADANLRLIYDYNENNIIDTDELISSSTFSGTTSESINITGEVLDTGNYFVQVYQNGSNNTDYTLRLNTDYSVHLIAAEDDLGTIGTNPISRSNSLNIWDRSDIYRFNVASADNILVTVNAFQEEFFRLIQDSNNNEIIDDTEVIASGYFYYSDTIETIDTFVNAGSYFLQVFGNGRDTGDYNISVQVV